ncbi:hypothetical protein ACP70R_023980 [Stipagrostis hirtigluma subsp. patula]
MQQLLGRAMATHQCVRALSLLLLFAAVALAARDLDGGGGANPLPAPGGRAAPFYGYGAIPGFPPGGFFYGGPGGFFGGPGGGGGGGWGAGYGGPGGGYAHGGVEVPTVVCEEKGPCYGKKVACPKKCFWTYSRAGNGYGAGGGGGSCTVDCKAKCTATC